METQNAPRDDAAQTAGTVQLIPTWRAVMPILIEGIRNGTPTGQSTAQAELTRLAQLTDELSASLTAIVREQIFGDGTAACQQRVIDLCIAAQQRFGIERAHS